MEDGVMDGSKLQHWLSSNFILFHIIKQKGALYCSSRVSAQGVDIHCVIQHLQTLFGWLFGSTLISDSFRNTFSDVLVIIYSVNEK